MPRKRVLVFEDNAIVRSTLKQVLDQLGFDVLAFPEPGFCPLYDLEKCMCPPEHACSDIIISDIDMPGVSGIEFVADQIRKGCKVKHIALMSGGWSVGYLRQANSLGCKTFSKPFNLEDLKKWLEECDKRIEPVAKLHNWFDKHPPAAGKSCK